MFTRQFLIAITLLTTFLSAGCSSHPPQAAKGAFGLENQIHPAYANNLIPETHADPGPLVGQDPLVGGGDPLVGPDTMGGDQLVGKDTLAGDGGSSSTVKNRPIKNWYWLKGSIANGVIIVDVNGLSIGRFSVRIDKEISDYLDRGSNDVKITTLPTVPGQPVDCDLEIVYSQQAPGALPVATYNSSTNGLSSTAAPGTMPNGGSVGEVPGFQSSLPPIDPMSQSGGSTSKDITFIAL